MDLLEAFPQLKRRKNLKKELMKIKEDMNKQAATKETEHLNVDEADTDEEDEKKPKKISIKERQNLPHKKRGVHGMNDLPKQSFFDFLFGGRSQAERSMGAGRRLKDGAYVEEDSMYDTILLILPFVLLLLIFLHMMTVWKLQRRVNNLSAELSKSRFQQPTYIMWPPSHHFPSAAREPASDMHSHGAVA